jgi:hypothetical protein
MHNELPDMIGKYLLEEEKVIWVGKSAIKKIFTAKDVLLIPISSVFFIAALLVELSSIIMIIDPAGSQQKSASSSMGVGLAIGGMLFVFITFYISIGRFILKKDYKKKSIYAVTDKRVFVILKYGKQEKLIESHLNKISDIHISVQKCGNGTLEFGEIDSINKIFNRSMLYEALTYPNEEIPIFYDIDDAEKIYTLVNNLKNHI